jgi:hypothetical protein
MTDIQRRPGGALATDELLERARAISTAVPAAALRNTDPEIRNEHDEAAPDDDGADEPFHKHRIVRLTELLRAKATLALHGQFEDAYEDGVDFFRWHNDLIDYIRWAMVYVTALFARRIEHLGGAVEFLEEIGILGAEEFVYGESSLGLPLQSLVAIGLEYGDSDILDELARWSTAVLIGCCRAREPQLTHDSVMGLVRELWSIFENWSANPTQMMAWDVQMCPEPDVYADIWNVPPVSDLILFAAEAIEDQFRALFGPMPAVQ